MLQILVDGPIVLALSFDGHLSRADLGKCFELIEPKLASDGKLHLYVEVTNLSGLDSEILLHDLSRGLRLMKTLDRFGRIAVVSDQDWVRHLSRVESALLPGISYRVYRSAEREQALAWVEGRAPLPYGQAVRFIETDRPEVLGIEIDGRLTDEEMARVSAELNRRREARRIEGLLLRVRSLGRVDPSIALDGEYLRMKLGFLGELNRYAVIGGPDWLRDWLNFFRPFVRFELRHFEPAAETAAWTWLGAKPLVEEAVAA